MANEEEGFTFVDRRRTGGEADTSADEPRVGVESEADTEADVDGDEALDGPHPRLGARDRLLMCIDILYQGAWIAMGLVNDPVTGQVERDLAEARLLIDSAGALAEQVQPHVDDATRRDLKNLISDLRVNFVQQTNR
ncbi:MAG: DUF1844 domain-containing protein [Chthonomonadales bacterium]|nr:DUF1844 domain-containing protein [Chthonomonadales bacterium]